MPFRVVLPTCSTPGTKQKPNQRKKRWSGFCGWFPSPFYTSATLFAFLLNALNVVIEVLRLKDQEGKKSPQGTNFASMLVCPFGCPVIVVVAFWVRIHAHPKPTTIQGRAASVFSLIRLFFFVFQLHVFGLTVFNMSQQKHEGLPRMQGYAQGVFYFFSQPPQGKPKFLSPRTPLTPWLTKIRSGEGLISGGENHLIYLVKNSNSPLNPLLVFYGWGKELANKTGPQFPHFVRK